MKLFEGPRDRVRDALLAAIAVAVLVAAWFGWSWLRAAHDDSLALARDRDAVLRVAGDGLVSLYTVDYHTAERDVDTWLRQSTGQLGRDLAGDRQLHLERARATRTVSTASLRQAAVLEVNRKAASARLIAVLDVRFRIGDGPPSDNRSRVNVDLASTADGWKVSAVQAAQ
jgi:Mce-associated membrane protein